MKKYRYIALVLLLSLSLFFSSCEKYCSCTMQGEEQPEIIEVGLDESCSDYSGASHGDYCFRLEIGSTCES